MAMEKTYSMIKPDGVRNGHIGEIIARFERAGLTIERMELGMVTLEQAKANYAEHEGKPSMRVLSSTLRAVRSSRWSSPAKAPSRSAVR